MNKLINEELDRIIKEKGYFNSRHEGYAVLLEELQELQEEYYNIENYLNGFWDKHCRKDTKKANNELMAILDCLDYRSQCLIKEAIQVAAVIKKIKVRETL